MTRIAVRSLAWMLSVVALLAPATSHAAFADWRGHLAIGYGRLFIADAPSGGFSVGAGVDHPITSSLRIGPDIGIHLLGTRTVERGSLNANLDYGLFEATLMAHWTPRRLGPVRRLSMGVGVMNARAEITSSSSGLAFEDLEVYGLRSGVAFDAALLPAGPRPVAVGLEAGLRFAFLESETWALGSLRLVFHY
ncbi:MAG: hypothetical protein HYR73_03440 [Candidatus Eisenbacteria bacterium]|nr:hypothetical protein [Candidatus Eisenbacteria bacterium]